MSSEVAGFDAATGLFSLSWWLAAILAAVLVSCLVLAAAKVGVGPLLIGAGGSAAIVFIFAMAWNWMGRTPDVDRTGRRDAVAARAFELASRAIAPGSALACLDSTAGELVELSCEKALFASPEAVAAATSYVAARVALLASSAEPRTNRAAEDGAVAGLRASLEDDRFGLVAQVLVAAYGCTAEKCDALGIFRNAARLRTNLKERPFDLIVARNALSWPARTGAAAVAAAPPANRIGPSPVPPGFIVPSSASIPPVSIMTPEGPPARTAPPARPAANVPPPATTAGNTPPRAQ